MVLTQTAVAPMICHPSRRCMSPLANLKYDQAMRCWLTRQVERIDRVADRLEAEEVGASRRRIDNVGGEHSRSGEIKPQPTIRPPYLAGPVPSCKRIVDPAVRQAGKVLKIPATRNCDGRGSFS